MNEATARRKLRAARLLRQMRLRAEQLDYWTQGERREVAAKRLRALRRACHA